MSEQFWGTTSFAQQQARHAQVVFYSAFLALAGPLATAAAWLLSRQALSWRFYLMATPLSVLWVWRLLLYLEQVNGPLTAVGMWWVGLTLACPAGSLVIKGWRIVFDFMRPRDLDEHLQEQQQYYDWKNAQLSRDAARREGQTPPARPAWLNLGVHIKGDRLPDHLGVARQGHWVQLADPVLDQHLLMVGATGAGKSQAIKRLVAETLAATDRDIFLVDGKGDVVLAREVAQMIYQARRRPVPIFTLGMGERGCIYHGFCGAREAVWNRLVALVGAPDASGDARFYADINRDLLQLACYAGEDVPRSFEELLARLNLAWLQDAYRGNALEQPTVDTIPQSWLDGLLVHLRPLARSLQPLMGPEGFVLEEQQGAIFSLRTQSVPDSARTFLDFFIEDIKDFVGNRQRRPGLLIIDEFGSFQNENIIDLLMMARSARLGVVLATQDVSTLGGEEQRQRILSNTRTKLLMATDFPEQIAQLAGTIYQIEASIQHEEGQATGLGSARVQHAFRIDMNEAARLQPGEAFLIRQRHVAKLRVKQVGDVPFQEEALLRLTKAPRPTASLPPEPKRKSKRKKRPVDLPDLEL